MQTVGVLELIDQNKAETLLVVATNDLVSGQKLIASHQKFAEVDHAFSVALLFIKRINFGFLSPLADRRDHQVFSTQAVFFGVRDKALNFTRGETFFGYPVRFHQAFNGRELIALIENLKRLRQSYFLVVATKHAVTQTVERPHPHATRINSDRSRDTGEHFFGSLIGKGHGQNFHRRDILFD